MVSMLLPTMVPIMLLLEMVPVAPALALSLALFTFSMMVPTMVSMLLPTMVPIMLLLLLHAKALCKLPWFNFRNKHAKGSLPVVRHELADPRHLGALRLLTHGLDLHNCHLDTLLHCPLHAEWAGVCLFILLALRLFLGVPSLVILIFVP